MTGIAGVKSPTHDPPHRPRTGLVLSGGGARGAYEAGVLSLLYDEVLPELGRDFEFDVIAGTSVGAIHAGFVAATSHFKPEERAQELRDIWGSMSLDQVLRVSPRDLVEVPLRALGMETLVRSARDQQDKDLLGGLVDITPLGRTGRAEEIGDAVVYFSAQSGTWVTGQVLAVDGGMVIPEGVSFEKLCRKLYGDEVMDRCKGPPADR